jgi:hypothetical protein
MNYLELCQAVRSRVISQGSGPSSVAGSVGVEADIVDSVRDAWIDIQNYRNTQWDWMRATVTFSTVAGTTTYVRSTVGGLTNRIDKYIKDTLYLNDGTEWKKLIPIDYDEFILRHKNDDEQVIPNEFTIRRSDQALIFEEPDDAYSVSVDYWKTPQILENNTDSPEFDVQWHNLIIYLAIAKLGVSVASPSHQMEYSQAFAEGMGQLMRRQVEKKFINVRSIA